MKAKKPSVWDRLRIAHEKKRGLRLSAFDVDTLILMDTAIHDAAYRANEDKPEKPQASARTK